ncbi:MAG: hypothetical protein F4Y89_01925 [Gammaproteobacteria bacterium]|nr:hypothetical protein [Gammaproteobacteria bacterium]MXZ32508.1 hypothetical protein [Gammaproteobacteria bacterium]MYG95581.1 hypothetical protein [Gammaproteobacteria bacterium]
MLSPHPPANHELLYEADDRPSLPLTLGLGMQNTALNLAGVVLAPTILITTAGESDAYLNWAVFAALIVCGIATIVQAVRFGRLGAGYILVMGSTSAFLAVSVSAIEQGGPALLATLIIVASFVQFILGSRMAALRRVFTPTVAGTVLMLIPVSIAPIVFAQLTDVPAAAAPAAAPVTALVTLAASVLVSLRLTGIWRLWAPAIGLVSGSLAGAAFGIYDIERVATAPWIGLPDFSAYPGFDLSFNTAFWALLPGFIIVTLVGAMDTLGDTIAIQRASWRKPRAIDFRSIQGAINADGLGNLLSGIAGTVPNTTYGNSIAVVEITGVAARRVGICVGLLFIMLACLPKILAVVIAMPRPVAGAYLAVIISLLFVFGIKILINDGLDYRKSLIVGFAFWVGLSFQFDMIYPELLQGALGEILGHGMTAGGITVILLSSFLDLTRSRPRRLRATLSNAALPEIDAFLCDFARRVKFDEGTTTRLRAVGEETLHILLGNGQGESDRDLLLVARADGKGADLEFIAGGSDMNLEDQLALLSEGVADIPNESEAPLRLLRHYATSVRHQQYHGTDIATIRLEPQSA